MPKVLGYEEFIDALGDRESNNLYDVENTCGFLGRWQFGKPRLYDAGYSIDGYAPKKYPQKKILSKQDFLDNKDFIQDRVMSWHVLKLVDSLSNGTFIMKDGDYKVRKKYSSFVGKRVNGIAITLSGLVAGAHLKGLGGVQMFLNGIENEDGYGTKISE